MSYTSDDAFPYLPDQCPSSAGRALNEEILFSDSIPVLDAAVLQVRKMVRDEGYDPLELPAVERSNSMGVQVTKQRQLYAWATIPFTFHLRNQTNDQYRIGLVQAAGG